MRKRARLVNAWTTSHAGVVLIILAFLSAFQLAYFSWENRETTNCQTRYNTALAQNLQIRAYYAERDRDNLVSFIRRISESRSREESRKALEDYLREQDRIEKERQSHPIPELPPGRCS